MARMYKKELLDYFDGSPTEAAKVIGVSRQTIWNWPELIPEQWAWQIEGRTRGALLVNRRFYEGDDK